MCIFDESVQIRETELQNFCPHDLHDIFRYNVYTV